MRYQLAKGKGRGEGRHPAVHMTGAGPRRRPMKSKGQTKRKQSAKGLLGARLAAAGRRRLARGAG